MTVWCHRPSHQFSVVAGAGTLLGDPHTEAGQAAIWVVHVEVEVVGTTGAA